MVAVAVMTCIRHGRMKRGVYHENKTNHLDDYRGTRTHLNTFGSVRHNTIVALFTRAMQMTIRKF